uniref:(northern house mosquito) hypothetical protein n=1 Tax=Culex pipiens TaxID=7175 RepID=A0A8D8F401_CULPI
MCVCSCLSFTTLGGRNRRRLQASPVRPDWRSLSAINGNFNLSHSLFILNTWCRTNYLLSIIVYTFTLKNRYLNGKLYCCEHKKKTETHASSARLKSNLMFSCQC